MIPVNNVV